MKSTQGFQWTRMEDHLPQAGQELTDALNAVVTKAVLDIQGDAVAQAPVRTGLLKSSIQAIRPDAWGDEILGGVGSNVEYAAYVELGTGQRGAASPYPYPSNARYTPSWPGMRAQAMIANAGKRAEPGYKAALSQVGQMMPRKV